MEMQVCPETPAIVETEKKRFALADASNIEHLRNHPTAAKTAALHTITFAKKACPAGEENTRRALRNSSASDMVYCTGALVCSCVKTAATALLTNLILHPTNIGKHCPMPDTGTSASALVGTTRDVFDICADIRALSPASSASRFSQVRAQTSSQHSRLHTTPQRSLGASGMHRVTEPSISLICHVLLAPRCSRTSTSASWTPKHAEYNSNRNLASLGIASPS